ncbi:hypothetical protein PR048_030273 [Dryococelus australis]|uniref:Uncharacterized protein n=1 Tax=Dryococelus australis TaxID=614101 RepID=A0ABQ9G8I3_9NEOP|nr:hypothetical protein PR048_030273 [Dryococelus australis]
MRTYKRKTERGKTPSNRMETASKLVMENPDSHWLTAFMKRNPELSVRQAEPTSLARCTSFNKTNVSQFCEKLSDLFSSDKIPHSRIFRGDDIRGEKLPSSLTLRKRPLKKKSIPQMKRREKKLKQGKRDAKKRSKKNVSKEKGKFKGRVIKKKNVHRKIEFHESSSGEEEDTIFLILFSRRVGLVHTPCPNLGGKGDLLPFLAHTSDAPDTDTSSPNLTYTRQGHMKSCFSGFEPMTSEERRSINLDVENYLTDLTTEVSSLLNNNPVFDTEQFKSLSANIQGAPFHLALSKATVVEIKNVTRDPGDYAQFSNASVKLGIHFSLGESTCCEYMHECSMHVFSVIRSSSTVYGKQKVAERKPNLNSEPSDYEEKLASVKELQQLCRRKATLCRYEVCWHCPHRPPKSHYDRVIDPLKFLISHDYAFRIASLTSSSFRSGMRAVLGVVASEGAFTPAQNCWQL